MKTRIYYFSGTGNSLALARGLATRLKGAELINLRRCDSAAWTDDADRVGIVFPVYAFGPPRLVARFLAGFATSASYVFAVCDCGGSPGNTLGLVSDALLRRGIRLQAGFSIVMPNNYTPLAGAPTETKQQQLFRNAEDRLDRIAAQVEAGIASRPEKTRWLPGWLSNLIYRGFLRGLKKAPRKFFVTAQCSGCGLCEKICPVKNIVLKDGKPCWDERCELCFACIQWCPCRAIALGREYPHRRRYHHPKINASDLM